MVFLHLQIGIATFIISFCTFLNVSRLCILHPWRWSHDWSKLEGFHCVYKL